MTSRDGAETPDPLAWLLMEAREAPPPHLPALVAEAFARVGARAAAMYLVDHDHTTLHPFPPWDDGASFAIDGTVGGRAFAMEVTAAMPIEGGTRLWLPLVDGTARLGVVSVDLDDAERPGRPAQPAGPGPPNDADPLHRLDPALVQRCELLAALAAELVVSKSNYTDVVEMARRGRAMTLESELQRCTLPPVSLVTAGAVVSGILEPAYEVAGDTFDYAFNADDLHVAVIDSVGHELRSSLISHLVYGSLRNSRRHGVDLPEAYMVADRAVAEVFPDVRFATAVFGRLDLRTGRFSWVSAGHAPPLLVRGGKVVGEAPVDPALPIGLGGGSRPTVNELLLEPGDVLLLYTDGVTEGGAPGSERFGLERLSDLLARSLLDGVPPAETLRRLAFAVLEHSAHELRDDACMVLVEYRGQPADV